MLSKHKFLKGKLLALSVILHLITIILITETSYSAICPFEGNWSGTWQMNSCNGQTYLGNWNATIDSNCYFTGVDSWSYSDLLRGPVDPATGVGDFTGMSSDCGPITGKGNILNSNLSGSWIGSGTNGTFKGTGGQATITYYRDFDNDGYGDPSMPYDSNSQPSGFATDNKDCNDYDLSINPGATEICGDAIDQDCNGSDTSCESNSDLAYEIQKLYIGYLGRAADKAGLDYWVNDIATGVMTMEQLRANLTNEQPEYTAIYGGLTRMELVSQIYRNLFEREPDADGLEYWVNGGGSSVNADQLIVAFLNAASTADQLVLDNRTTEAMHYTEMCGDGVGQDCGVSDDVVTVTSAGQVWMDRNLGAARVATSPTDSEAYGDLYQWGRSTDGHEKRTSPITLTLSAYDVPGHGSFATSFVYPYDWRTPQNENLWQGVSGTNNPCPSGFRLPTDIELDTERASWSSNNSAGAFASPLKLVVAGIRDHSSGSLDLAGSYGVYWSSTGSLGCLSRFLKFSSGGDTDIDSFNRASGFSVRCIKGTVK